MSSTTPDDEKPKVASPRRHLRPEEAAKLIAAAGKRGRYPERDKLLLRLAYPQGLRAAVLGAIRPSPPSARHRP
jgi:integrase